MRDEPANMELMGAKDALTKIKDMDFGLPDTLGYYSPADMKAGFPKTIAFQKRVVKQNRGSSGEGIWIIDLKKGNYCANYGDRVAGMDEVLICEEANDNHTEEHGIAEFIEWCENGRTGKSGRWTSKGTGKYFEGGVEAGGQMVDQRFCPRISEGEALRDDRQEMFPRGALRLHRRRWRRDQNYDLPGQLPRFPGFGEASSEHHQEEAGGRLGPLRQSARPFGKGHPSSVGRRLHSCGRTQDAHGDRRVQLLLLGARRVLGRAR